ncbi:NAD(P)H-dependent oxidoreductase [Nonomuraea sp. SMC257]|uniref:NAD(P)H-dependent oxidoreductase n=1 Tax=Nonomuraea montanisoli TaxID=2741721 RepID=A0A7Y6I968_9ACTN|nr:NAD(P)H-dependent oxidoreductase [Nonomuraea montanisoli]
MLDIPDIGQVPAHGHHIEILREQRVRIIGIAASLHAGSFINRLLTAVGGELPSGVDFTPWTDLAAVPPFTAGPVPDAPSGLLRLVDDADALLLIAPEHSLLPVELGDALRWLSASGALTGRHVAVMSASARPCGAMWAQAELYRQLTEAGAVVMGAELVISPLSPHFDERGRLTVGRLREQVRDVVSRLCPAAVGEPVPVMEAVPLRQPALKREAALTA